MDHSQKSTCQALSTAVWRAYQSRPFMENPVQQEENDVELHVHLPRDCSDAATSIWVPIENVTISISYCK